MIDVFESEPVKDSKSFSDIPNLFSFMPVAMYGCVFASIAGFTLIAILALSFSSEAMLLILISSE